jgi:hypothetical protein
MNILGYLGGTPASIKEPIPTDLEIALQRMHSDHRLAMEAIKLLTDVAQSTASGNLSMAVVHQERHATALNMLRDLKSTIVTSDSKHFAAFERAMRPVTRDMGALNDKVLNVEGEMYALRSAINNDREAQLVIQNTKLNAIAIRIDALTKLLAKNLIKHPEGATVAPTCTHAGPPPSSPQPSRTPASASAPACRAAIAAATSGKVIAQLVRANEAPEKGTGWHRHEHDYVVVPMTDGELLAETT